MHDIILFDGELLGLVSTTQREHVSVAAGVAFAPRPAGAQNARATDGLLALGEVDRFEAYQPASGRTTLVSVLRHDGTSFRPAAPVSNSERCDAGIVAS